MLAAGLRPAATICQDSSAHWLAGQLRYQELAAPEVGTPPVLLAKGAAVPFTAGAPIAVWAPTQPGFQRFVGRSLFAWGQYACEGSLRWAPACQQVDCIPVRTPAWSLRE